MSIYKVTIADAFNFPADQRIRSGITVLKATGYQGELTDEQLEAIEADSYLAVEEVTEPAAAPAKPIKK